jgi:hypothetical protein
VLWVVSATAAGLAWFVTTSPGNRLGSPLLHLGLLVGCLGADDMFLLHESAVSRVGGEKFMLAAYVCLTAAFAWRHRAFLRRRARTVPLLVAMLFFGVSVTIDQVYDGHLYLVEDGAKLLGIATLTAVVLRLALDALTTSRAGQLGDRAVWSAPPADVAETEYRHEDAA